MKMPEGIPNPLNKVCKLQKSLYGLKQASRQWFAKLTVFLQHHGYVQFKNDYSLFLKHSGSHLTVVAIYVDDILVTGSNLADILLLKQHLHSTFGINDLGPLHFFWASKSHIYLLVSLCPRGKFTTDLLQDTGFLTSKPAATPFPLHYRLSSGDGDLLPDPSLYRALVGKLNFLTHTLS